MDLLWAITRLVCMAVSNTVLQLGELHGVLACLVCLACVRSLTTLEGCTWRRLPEEHSEAPGSLTTFADIATRQEQEQEDHEGLHSTVRLHIISAWLLTQYFSMILMRGGSFCIP